jgi:catechol 2,3-dioxygenase-like lactoylglutathione lyase family enzyme
VEVLSSRVIVRCADLERSVAFWTDTVGLRTYREYGAGGRRAGLVLFCGGGFLELTVAHRPDDDEESEVPGVEGTVLWLQVPDVDEEAARLVSHGVSVSVPRTEPWGLREAWFADPDGLRVVLVEVPDGHPIRSRIDG